MAFTYVSGSSGSNSGDSAAPATTTITAPSEGDLVVVGIHSNSTTSVTHAGGEGTAFNSAYDAVSSPETNRLALFWKVAGASEPTSYTFAAGNAEWRCIVKTFTSASDAEVDLTASHAREGSKNSDGILITAGASRAIGSDAVAIVFGGKDNRAGAEAYTTATDSFTGVLGDQTSQCAAMAHRIYSGTGTGANVDIDTADGGDVNDNSFGVHMSWVESGGNITKSPGTSSPPPAFTGNTPSLGVSVSPGTGSIAFNGRGTTGGPYSSGIDHMGSGWGVGLAFVGQPVDRTVSDVGGGNIVIDGSQTPDLDPDPLITTGNAPSLGTSVSPTTGALQFTENTPSAEIDHFRDVGTRSLAFTGIAPTAVDVAVAITPSIGSLEFAGKTPSAEIEHNRDVGLDTLQFSSDAPIVLTGITRQPTTGSIEFSGKIPTLDYTWVIFPGKDALQFTGKIPTLDYTWVTFPGLDTLLFTGYEPTLKTTIIRDPSTGSLAFTEKTPTPEIDHFRDVGLDTLQFNSDAPLVFTGLLVQPGSGSLEFTEDTPSAEIEHNRDVGLDTLQFSSDLTTITVGIKRTPTTGSLQFTEDTPSAEIDHFRDVGTDTLQFTGDTPTAEIDHIRDVGADALQTASDAPTIKVGLTSEPGLGSLSFNGYGVTGGPIVTGLDTMGSGWGVGLNFVGQPLTIDRTTGPVAKPTVGSLEFTEDTPSAEITHIRDVGTDSLGLSGEGVFESGTHSQLNNHAVLIDQIKLWTVDEWVGYLVRNLTDGSEGLITANSKNIVTATLSGGTDNDWDISDSYEIVWPAPSAEITHIRGMGAPDALALTGYVPPSVQVSHPIDVPTTSIEFGYQDPYPPGKPYNGPDAYLYAFIDHYRDVGTVSLQFTGSTPDPETALSPEIDVDTGSISFTGNIPTLEYDWTASPTTGSIAFTGNTPVVGSTSLIISPSTGSIAFTGNTFTKIDVAHSGISIINPNATTDVPSNYEQCDYTGFRQMPGSLKLTWNKHAVRRKSWESRHPQEIARSVPQKQKGSRRPEQADRFIEDIGTVDSEDL